MKRWKRGLFLFVSIGIVVVAVTNFALCDSITLSTQLGAGGGLWTGEDTDADGNLDAIHTNEDSWRVGIGTAAPSGTLDVQGGTAPDDTDGTDITLNAQDGGPISLESGTNGGNIILMPGNGVGTGSSGNVGIGTTVPARKLVVQDDRPDNRTLVSLYNVNTTNNNGAVLSFRTDTTGEGASTHLELAGIRGQFNQHDHANRSASLVFGTTDSGLPITERMVIAANGNVGIGTTAPDYSLDVYDGGKDDSIDPTTVSRVRGFGHILGTGYGYAQLVIESARITGSHDYPGIEFKGSSGTHALIRSKLGDGLEFVTFDNGAGGKTVVMMKEDGNVGIGTTTPVGKLEVNTGTADDGIFIRNGTTENARLFWDGTNVGRLRLLSAGIEKVNIRAEGVSYFNAGNVGIGTTSPGGKLDVNGTIYQRGVSLHADYVFEPGYKLESIEDHSRYMWANKHLQAVPKAQKDEQGQDMVEYGARSRGSLEELEKAHVYIEQLNERVKALEAKVAEKE